MKVGRKAQGQEAPGKELVHRHTNLSKGTARRCEKALETRVRRAGRREIRDQAP